MVQNSKAILADIRTVFEDAAVLDDSVLMASYMKGITPFLGLRNPLRRALQKKNLAQYKGLPFAEVEVLIRLLWKQPEREFHYLALDWLWIYRKSFVPKIIDLIEDLIITKSWWDTVDTISAKILGYWAQAFPDTARPIIKHYIQSSNFWLSRAAMIHQLSYKEKTDVQLLSDAITPHLLSKEFFLRKAIGWALRQYARTDAVWVENFVNTHPEMSGLSKREALKHLR